jgi:hypothetical protein
MTIKHVGHIVINITHNAFYIRPIVCSWRRGTRQTLVDINYDLLHKFKHPFARVHNKDLQAWTFVVPY